MINPTFEENKDSESLEAKSTKTVIVDNQQGADSVYYRMIKPL